MIFPRIFRRANMDGLLVDYAHRGLHSESLPENSIGAFEAATEKGIGIELDIQLSKDGVPMVFHDDNLSRVCGIDAPLSKFTADELCQMKLLDTEYTIPTFAETLSVINGRVPILVEFKPGNMELCRRGCDMLDNYNGKFCVESFDSILLGMIRRYRPEFSRGQLVGNMFKSRNPKNPSDVCNAQFYFSPRFCRRGQGSEAQSFYRNMSQDRKGACVCVDGQEQGRARVL